MRTPDEIENKSRQLSNRLARHCEHDGDMSARVMNGAANAMCPCFEAHRYELRSYEACIPKKFWHMAPESITHNVSVYRELIVPYCSDKGLRKALGDGLGIFMHGPNGCGKTTFIAMILLHLIRNTRASVYYTTALQLDKDIKSGFNSSETENRLDQYMKSHFVAIDELGKERFRDNGDSFIRREIERHLRWRNENGLPTLLASNATLDALRKGTQDGGYGETFGSIIDGHYYEIPMEPGDMRLEVGNKLRDDFHVLIGGE